MSCVHTYDKSQRNPAAAVRNQPEGKSCPQQFQTREQGNGTCEVERVVVDGD
ncbi:MAG: hypothetical protein NC125_02120 [Muribaculaceae bacterium]|nr:hypothetical protein [Muribaculaceae bacterium]